MSSGVSIGASRRALLDRPPSSRSLSDQGARPAAEPSSGPVAWRGSSGSNGCSGPVDGDAMNVARLVVPPVGQSSSLSKSRRSPVPLAAITTDPCGGATSGTECASSVSRTMWFALRPARLRSVQSSTGCSSQYGSSLEQPVTSTSPPLLRFRRSRSGPGRSLPNSRSAALMHSSVVGSPMAVSR